VFREETVIAAEPRRIWELLVDLDGYAGWNPWITRAAGEVAPGGKVSVHVVMGKKTMRVAHEVLVVEPEQRFCWRDSGWSALFVYGQRCRTLTPLGDGTVRFTNELMIEGVLASVAKRIYGADLTSGIAAETAALRSRAQGA
jgi:uncharacterized protein YndB with AHSA1/START domain